MSKKQIGVYGLGRFGRFWAEVLTRDFQVKAWNRTHRDISGSFSITSEDEVLSCDAVFFCVAISSFETVLRSAAPRIGNNTVVFDTCSVKSHPAHLMLTHLKKNTPCIATHPMFGPDSAARGMEGLPMVFSPLRCEEKDSTFWREYFSHLGLRVIEMTPEEHDLEAAMTQGITHVIGRVLEDLDLKPSGIGTLGYRKILEVVEQTCNDPYQLFLDLQHYNPHTHTMRLKLKESLDRMMRVLEEADPYS